MASTKPVPSFSLTSSEAKKIHLGLCLHQHPLSIISTQHPSSPACSPGTWHQDSNQVLWIFFPDLFTLDSSLMDTTSISPL